MAKWLPSLLSLISSGIVIFEPQIQVWMSAHLQVVAIIVGVIGVLNHLAPSPINNGNQLQ